EAFLKEFGGLAETEGGIERLRLLVLDLGVAGRLGTSTMADVAMGSPVEELLRYREDLHRRGEIKRVQPVPEVGADEVLFEVPSHWGWTRLGAVGDWGAGATPARSNSDF